MAHTRAELIISRPCLDVFKGKYNTWICSRFCDLRSESGIHVNFLRLHEALDITEREISPIVILKPIQPWISHTVAYWPYILEWFLMIICPLNLSGTIFGFSMGVQNTTGTRYLNWETSKDSMWLLKFCNQADLC